MAWQQLSIITGKDTVAPVSGLLSELGALSVTYLDAAEQPVYEPQPGETKIWQRTRITGLFSMDHDLDIVKSLISQQLATIRTEDWQIEILADKIWEREWMQYYQPMKFGNRLWVCPTGQQRFEPDTVCLRLDPGLAFGTGTHPTTALCLDWLARHDLQDKTVIDYGCGSGILAIAALLLGAKQAYAVDIDAQALTATRDNAEKNQVSRRIDICLDKDFPAVKADIVIANILAKPLLELAPQLAGYIESGGWLILSGILREQAIELRQGYARHLTMSAPVFQDDWCLLEGRAF